VVWWTMGCKEAIKKSFTRVKPEVFYIYIYNMNAPTVQIFQFLVGVESVTWIANSIVPCALIPKLHVHVPLHHIHTRST
jgi:hypothetical protein